MIIYKEVKKEEWGDGEWREAVGLVGRGCSKEEWREAMGLVAGWGEGEWRKAMGLLDRG